MNHFALFSYVDVFLWPEEVALLNTNVVQASSSASLRDISELRRTVRQMESFYREGLKLTKSSDATPEDKALASRALADSAWIYLFISDKVLAEPADAASAHIKLALQLAEPNSKTWAFAQYINSAVFRRKNDFENAFEAAKQALAIMPEEPHAHIQCGLTALRLGLNTEAIGYFESAIRAAESIHTFEEGTFTVHHLLTIAEGDALERALMNLAQVHNKMKNHQAALECFNHPVMQDYAASHSFMGVAYKNNVHAEAYLGLGDYDNAKRLLLESHNIYKEQDKQEDPNCLRALLGLLEVSFGRGEELPEDYLAEATRLHAKHVGPNKEEHDFSVRLNNVQLTSLAVLSSLSL